MIIARIFLLFCLLLSVAGCSVHSVDESQLQAAGKKAELHVGDSANKETILPTALVMSGENFQVIESVNFRQQPHWLVVEENSALSLLGADMAPVHKLEGNFETVDYRQWRDSHWVLTADSIAEELVIYNLSKKGFKSVARPQAPSFGLEGFCLYADANNGLFAFILGGDGMLEQRWLYGANGEWLDKTIKVLPVGPGAETCAVDDASATLFLLEEDVGIWKYPAAPEASWQRKPLDFLTPWGPLPGDGSHSGIGSRSIVGFRRNRYSRLCRYDRRHLVQGGVVAP